MTWCQNVCHIWEGPWNSRNIPGNERATDLQKNERKKSRAEWFSKKKKSNRYCFVRLFLGLLFANFSHCSLISDHFWTISYFFLDHSFSLKPTFWPFFVAFVYFHSFFMFLSLLSPMLVHFFSKFFLPICWFWPFSLNSHYTLLIFANFSYLSLFSPSLLDLFFAIFWLFF